MSTRLYVGNLAYHTTDESLAQVFAGVAEVAEVKVMIDRETGRSRGFAFVEMATAEGARKAIEQLDGAVVEGRPLRVNEAQERQPRAGGFGGGGGGGGPRGGGGGFGGPRGGDRGGDRGGRRDRRF
jgi:RNA recognition motif-containing protein